MSTIYHNQSSSFDIPNNWVKNKEFNPCDVNERNIPWQEGIDQGTRYRLISRYEEHYGILARIGRVAFGVMLSLIMVSFAFKSGREFVGDLLFNSVKNAHIIREIRDMPKLKMADVYVSMAGNPAHMGYMHMIALAINRLVEEGYQINQVKVALSSEQYLKDKVHYCNISIEKHTHDSDREPGRF